MRKLSVWAKHYGAYARIIIIISRILLILIAYFLAKQLPLFGLEVSPLWVYFFIAVFFIGGATYPSERSARNYSKRKLSDLIVALSGFALTFCGFTQLNQPLSIYETAQGSALVNPSPYKYAEAKRLLEQYQKGEKTKFSPKEKRIIKKEFKYQLIQYAKAKVTGNKANGEEAVLIILASIAAVGLLYLVLALSCTLACNGAEGAATALAILGTAAVIWGLIAVIRSIIRKREMPQTKSS